MDLQKLTVKADPRGGLVETFKLPNDGQVFYVLINPAETRGNHYHVRKTERFTVILGSATINVKNRETGDMMKVATSGQKPMLITVVPNHTHNFVAGNEGCILLAWVDEQFNEKDADTYPEEI